jgi:hypothetical protein
MIVWEQTNHSWDTFGIEVENEELKKILKINKNELEAKIIAIWKKLSLREFLEKVIETILEIINLRNSDTIIDDFISIITLFNIIPLEVKLVLDDEKANIFLDKVKFEEGEYFILKKDIEQYHNFLKDIVKYFIDNGLLKNQDDRYIIKGSVLNKINFLK